MENRMRKTRLTFCFGTHPFSGKPMEWIILSENKDEGTALIAATRSICTIPYSRNRSVHVSWKDSYVRQWLNQTFFRSFTAEEKHSIRITTTFEDDQEPVMDYFFLLNEGEASLYFENDDSRMLLDEEDAPYPRRGSLLKAIEWWLREDNVQENGGNRQKVPICNANGELGYSKYATCERTTGIRPCAWVDAGALREIRHPELEALNVRLFDKNRTNMIIYRDNRPQILDVLAEFADDDTKQVFAIVTDRILGKPHIIRQAVDFWIKTEAEKKYEPLLVALKTRPYHTVMEQLREQRDQKEVYIWMNQQAWMPTAGYHQPEINDRGNCLIQFGCSNSQKLWWKVLKRSSNKVLLLSETGILYDELHWTEDGIAFDVTWNTSTLRHWLNEGFCDSVFTPDERKHILYCRTVEETAATPPVFDLVFLLDAAEASAFLPNDQDRRISGTPKFRTLTFAQQEGDGRDCWWLRSGGLEAECFCYINKEGKINLNGVHYSEALAVRPAILIELTEDELPYKAIE